MKQYGESYNPIFFISPSKFCLIKRGRCRFGRRRITGGFSLSLERTENGLYKRGCCSILAVCSKNVLCSVCITNTLVTLMLYYIYLEKQGTFLGSSLSISFYWCWCGYTSACMIMAKISIYISLPVSSINAWLFSVRQRMLGTKNIKLHVMLLTVIVKANISVQYFRLTV